MLVLCTCEQNASFQISIGRTSLNDAEHTHSSIQYTYTIICAQCFFDLILEFFQQCGIVVDFINRNCSNQNIYVIFYLRNQYIYIDYYLNLFIENLHRILLSVNFVFYDIESAKKVHLLDLYIKTMQFLFYYIDYYMPFFISYYLSALGHDI
jgi:hypothetical protein